jgi:PAS domain S-box-containing protein
MGHPRDSGIDIIGHVKWGTHIAQLYSDQNDILEVAVPFLHAGLNSNELCVYIYTNDNRHSEHLSILRKSVKEFDEYIQKGQLLLIPHTDWYLKDNSFNEMRVDKQWKELVKTAFDKGFEGIRAVGDTGWLNKSYLRAFEAYERNISIFIKNLSIIALCLYDTEKIGIYETADILKNHDYILTKLDNKYKLIKNYELELRDKQLEIKEENYKSLIQLLPDIVFIHDENNIYYCNKAAYYMTGITAEELPSSKSVIDFTITKQKDKFRNYIRSALGVDKATHFIELQFICSDGNIKDMEIVTTKCVFNGKSVLISVFRDKTAFKRINELEKDIQKNKELLNTAIEQDRMKTEFFCNFSHELRTPINVILGALQLLEMDKDICKEKPNYCAYFKSMKQNCFRLIRLVNNIIDINEIEARMYELNKQNCDIVSLVEDITFSVIDYAKNKKIKIIFDTNVEKKVIACDADKIERVILNLISNAIKFSYNEGNILVSLIDCNNKVIIKVKDNGIGIPKENQKNIFNRYEQVDKSLRRRREGSGIGLSIVKGLVEMHGGTISVNSELGLGSEFIVELPSEQIESNSSKNNQYTVEKYKPNHYVERINVEFSDIYS